MPFANLGKHFTLFDEMFTCFFIPTAVILISINQIGKLSCHYEG